MRTTTRTRLATLAAVLVTLAGCGGTASNDDNGAPAAPAGDPTGDQPEQSRPRFDLDRLCSLLEPSEIDAEFGEHGSASEGTLFRDFRSCNWEIGDTSLQLRVLAYVENPRERLLSEREEQEQNPEYEFIDLTGVGEYAYAISWEDTTQLIFLAEGSVFYFFAYVPAVDELTTLARHVVDRI